MAAVKSSVKNHPLLGITVIAYLLGLSLIAGIGYWPRATWAYASLISFSPVWLLALPLLGLVPLCGLFRHFRLLAALGIGLLLCIVISGWTFSLSQPNPVATSSPDQVVIITANMGGGARVEALNQLLVENNADLVALQETSAENLASLLSMSPLNAVCEGELCLLSPLNLRLVDSKSRVITHPGESSGPFIMQVAVELPQENGQAPRNVDFYVLHLKTPRAGFQALLRQPFSGWRELFDVTDAQVTESWVAANWVAHGQHPIAAGDFNLPRRNPIFSTYWRDLQDSFQTSGTGFGYSKHTRVHGVQIDHILHSQRWTAVETWIGPSLGGDHSPVITRLAVSK